MILIYPATLKCGVFFIKIKLAKRPYFKVKFIYIKYMKTIKPILFTGIQPTGQIHLGNYIGAYKNSVSLQDKYFSIFSIVDLHAITIDYQPKNYQETIFNTAITLLSFGIDPKKSIFFVQSHILEHPELSWLFTTITPVGELERMTQYKDKSQKNQKNVNGGLLCYPILMAADILLYQAEYVPVGEDQYQHLEFTNMIVKKFNNKFGEFFKPLKTIVSPAPRIMSLNDPTRKMSKSDGAANCLLITDSPEIIKNKVMRAVTDLGPNKNNEMSPGVKNLFKLLELFGDNKTYNKFQTAYKNKTIKYSELKTELAEAIIKYLKPIQEKRKYFADNKIKVKKILEDGAKKARIIAQKNILEIKKKMGLL